MKNKLMMKRCVGALLIFALVLTTVIAMPADTQAATKYSKSASVTVQDKYGDCCYVIPITMKKTANVTVKVELVSNTDDPGVYGCINVFENISDFIDHVDIEDRKGKNILSDYATSSNKKATVKIKAKKGNTSGIVVGANGFSKVKVTVKCDNSYVKLGKVKDLTW